MRRDPVIVEVSAPQVCEVCGGRRAVVLAIPPRNSTLIVDCPHCTNAHQLLHVLENRK